MNTKMVSIGLMSALLACSGGAILIIQAAQALNISQVELYSWFMSVYIVGGLLNMYLALKFNIPFAGAHSITAIAFLGTLSSRFSFPELAGGFILSGMLIFLAGYTRLFSKILNHIPKPVIDALLAGLLLPYVIKIVPASISLPLSGLFSLFGYFVVPRIVKVLPSTIGALFFGMIGLSFEFHFKALSTISFQFPQIVNPEFSVTALFSIALPLCLLILSNDLAIALASLKGNGYEPPANRTLMASGFASMLVGCFGGHAANAGGMMSALCSSPEAGPKESRRWAGVVSSIIVLVLGLFSFKVIPLMQMLPSSFVTIMTGFSILGLFITALRSSFSDKNLRLPALLTFGVALSQIHLIGVATPVWALLTGGIALKWIRKKPVKLGGDE